MGLELVALTAAKESRVEVRCRLLSSGQVVIEKHIHHKSHNATNRTVTTVVVRSRVKAICFVKAF